MKLRFKYSSIPHLVCRFLALLTLSVALPAYSSTLIYTGAKIVDVETGKVEVGKDLIVRGDKILGLFETDQHLYSGDIINIAGRYLIPGLWDMHVHTWSEVYSIPLYVANGIVGVRDMAGAVANIHRWRLMIARGQLIGPEFVAAGPLVDGPKPIWGKPGSVAVANAEQGFDMVGHLQFMSSDFVKIYSLLPAEAFYAIAKRSKELGISFAGHVPMVVRAKDASNAGQKSMEHMYQLLGCSSLEEEIINEWIATDANRDLDSFLKAYRKAERLMVDTYDEERAEALFRIFKYNDTWQVPTLTVLDKVPWQVDPNVRTHPNLKYVPKYLRDYWLGLPEANAEQLAFQRKKWKLQASVVGKMQLSGVKVLAGSDTPNPFVVPGFSLHDELENFVNAGMTPREALQTATTRPLEYLGRKNRPLSPGSSASFVVLDGNPLADIRNTRKIRAVSVRGKYLNRIELDIMLARVEQAARSAEDSKLTRPDKIYRLDAQ